MAVSGIGAQLASQGLKAMFDPNVTGIQDQSRIGDSYVSSIASQSSDYNEQTVANTALRASQSVSLATAQVGIAEATMNAIAGGISGGPIGAVLAQVGAAAMYDKDVTTIHDQSEIAMTFACAVRDYTTDATQRGEATAAVNSASNVATARSQVDILGNFLQGR